jgi:hypothetical protein
MIENVRAVVASIASVWFALHFWWPGSGWRDWPPPMIWFVLVFHIPLALGLTLGCRLAVRSRGICRAIGCLCLIICVPAVLEIVLASACGRGVWVYSRR